MPVTSVHSPVAMARNGWSPSVGTTGRHRSEQVVAITRCALRPPRHDLGRHRRGRIEPTLQHRVRQLLRQRPADAGGPCRCRQSVTVEAPIARLAATLGLDRPAAVSRSTSRSLRMGNLSWGMSRSLLPGRKAAPIRGSPNGAHHAPPQAYSGARNSCSASIAATARHQPVRARGRPECPTKLSICGPLFECRTSGLHPVVTGAGRDQR